MGANLPRTVLCWSEVGERGWRQQGREKALKRRHESPAECVLCRVVYVYVCLGERDTGSLSRRGRWPDSLHFVYTATGLLGLNRNPVAVVVLHHLPTSSGVAMLQLEDGEAETSAAALCEGWNG